MAEDMKALKEKARLWGLLNDKWEKEMKNANHHLNRGKRSATIVREAGNHQAAFDLEMAIASLENVMNILTQTYAIYSKKNEVCPQCHQPLHSQMKDK